jgi:hypothetical protein
LEENQVDNPHSTFDILHSTFYNPCPSSLGSFELRSLGGPRRDPGGGKRRG